MTYFLGYIIVISMVTFLVFGIDKYKAKNQHRRISENMLLALTMAGGGIGAVAGMSFFRHKTIKGAFLMYFWLIIFVWVCACIWMLTWI